MVKDVGLWTSVQSIELMAMKDTRRPRFERTFFEKRFIKKKEVQKVLAGLPLFIRFFWIRRATDRYC